MFQSKVKVGRGVIRSLLASKPLPKTVATPLPDSLRFSVRNRYIENGWIKPQLQSK